MVTANKMKRVVRITVATTCVFVEDVGLIISSAILSLIVWSMLLVNAVGLWLIVPLWVTIAMATCVVIRIGARISRLSLVPIPVRRNRRR